MTQLIKSSEAAKLLGVGRTHFWKLVALYKLPAVRLSEKCVRFDPVVLAEFVKARTINNPEDSRRLADGRRKS